MGKGSLVWHKYQSYEQKLPVTAHKIYHIANTFYWSPLERNKTVSKGTKRWRVIGGETTGCLMFLPVGRMKLRSSAGRKASSHLVIDRFDPSHILETVWKRKVYCKSIWGDCWRETTQLQSVGWTSSLGGRFTSAWGYCLPVSVRWTSWAVLFSLDLESCFALELKVMRPAVAMSL